MIINGWTKIMRFNNNFQIIMAKKAKFWWLQISYHKLFLKKAFLLWTYLQPPIPKSRKRRYFSDFKLVKTSITDHPFSTCAKFSKKLTFLTPWYAHVRVRIRGKNISFSKNFAHAVNGWPITEKLKIGKLKTD